jgi:hypothetical protein
VPPRVYGELNQDAESVRRSVPDQSLTDAVQAMMMAMRTPPPDAIVLESDPLTANLV